MNVFSDLLSVCRHLSGGIGGMTVDEPDHIIPEAGCYMNVEVKDGLACDLPVIRENVESFQA
jgi:hypothetical protein